MRALDAALSSLWAPGAAAGGPFFGASPASECALRCEAGCTEGATRSTGTEGVGERYTALWPAKDCACESDRLYLEITVCAPPYRLHQWHAHLHMPFRQCSSIGPALQVSLPSALSMQ